MAVGDDEELVTLAAAADVRPHALRAHRWIGQPGLVHLETTERGKRLQRLRPVPTRVRRVDGRGERRPRKAMAALPPGGHCYPQEIRQGPTTLERRQDEGIARHCHGLVPPDRRVP